MPTNNLASQSVNGNVNEFPNVPSSENSANWVKFALIFLLIFLGIIAAGVLPAVLISQVAKTTTNSLSNSTSNSSSVSTNSGSTSSPSSSSSSSTSVCPTNTCVYSTWYTLTSSGYYGVEHVNINCTQTLSNFTAFIYVQTTVGATFANEYNTFWSGTVTQTYYNTSSQIIYFWTSIPGQTVSSAAFPVYVEAQFQLQGTNQTVTSDSYTVITQSACNGQVLTYSGYF